MDFSTLIYLVKMIIDGRNGHPEQFRHPLLRQPERVGTCVFPLAPLYSITVDSILLAITSDVIVAAKYSRAAFTITFFWSALIATDVQAVRESIMLVTSLTAPLLGNA